MAKRKQPKPTPLYDTIADAGHLVCGACGHKFGETGSVSWDNDLDVAGADEECGFCNPCGAHINLTTGAVVQVAEEP